METRLKWGENRREFLWLIWAWGCMRLCRKQTYQVNFTFHCCVYIHTHVCVRVIMFHTEMYMYIHTLYTCAHSCIYNTCNFVLLRCVCRVVLPLFLPTCTCTYIMCANVHYILLCVNVHVCIVLSLLSPVLYSRLPNWCDVCHC